MKGRREERKVNRRVWRAWSALPRSLDILFCFLCVCEDLVLYEHITLVSGAYAQWTEPGVILLRGSAMMQNA